MVLAVVAEAIGMYTAYWSSTSNANSLGPAALAPRATSFASIDTASFLLSVARLFLNTGLRPCKNDRRFVFQKPDFA